MQEYLEQGDVRGSHLGGAQAGWDGDACLGVRKTWRFLDPVRGGREPHTTHSTCFKPAGFEDPLPRGFLGAAHSGLA